MAMQMDAICIRLRTAAVGNPRLRLWIVALSHPRIGAYLPSIAAMNCAVIGTSFPLFSRTKIGLRTDNSLDPPRLLNSVQPLQIFRLVLSWLRYKIINKHH